MNKASLQFFFTEKILFTFCSIATLQTHKTKQNMVKGILINTDGTYQWIHTNELKEMQSLIGGDITPLCIAVEYTIFVNEEGLDKGLPRNVEGYKALSELGVHSMYDVFGPILMYGPVDEDCNETSFPEDHVCKFENILRLKK